MIALSHASPVQIIITTQKVSTKASLIAVLTASTFSSRFLRQRYLAELVPLTGCDPRLVGQSDVGPVRAADAPAKRH